MVIYAIAGIMLFLSFLVVFFAFKANALAVRAILSIVSCIPWIALIYFLSKLDH